MIEKELEIPTCDGSMNVYSASPDEVDFCPTVIFLMDAPGKRQELHDMAMRIATVGYHVLLPNLYYRKSKNFQMNWSEEGRKEMFEMTKHLSISLVMNDVEALLSHTDNDIRYQKQKVGVVGYCMSGPFSIAAASFFPDRICSAASIYGANLVTKRDDSPHKIARRARAELYFACAEVDTWASKETIKSLDRALADYDVRYRIEWYEGVEHGFAFPDRMNIYHRLSSEKHWNRLFSLFHRTLH